MVSLLIIPFYRSRNLKILLLDVYLFCRFSIQRPVKEQKVLLRLRQSLHCTRNIYPFDYRSTSGIFVSDKLYSLSSDAPRSMPLQTDKSLSSSAKEMPLRKNKNKLSYSITLFLVMNLQGFFYYFCRFVTAASVTNNPGTVFHFSSPIL